MTKHSSSSWMEERKQLIKPFQSKYLSYFHIGYLDFYRFFLMYMLSIDDDVFVFDYDRND